MTPDQRYTYRAAAGVLQIAWLPGPARWSLTLDGEPVNGNYHSAQSAASQAHHEFDDAPDALAEWTPRFRSD